MSDGTTDTTEPYGEFEIDDVLEHLDRLESTVTTSEEKQKVQRAKKMLERVPGGARIRKYTTRDIAEGFVGGIIFSLPLLVEDGVFEIAKWFATATVGPIPVFLTFNVAFICVLTYGLLYYTDIRQVKITKPIFGVLPRRFVGVLLISFLVAAGSMFLWGRLHADDPTGIEVFARITVIWAAAAFGATLGDILPGESSGEDINDLIN